VDVLTDILSRSWAHGAGFAYSSLHGDVGLSFPPGPGLAVHVMVDGEAYLQAGGPSASRVVAGDVVLVRGALAHSLAAETGSACVPLEEVLAAGPVAGTPRRYAVGRPAAAPAPAAAVFFCGAYLFDGDLCEGLLDGLPDSVVLRPATGSSLRATTDLLGREVLADAPGQQALLDRLLDVALVQVLRQHFDEAGDAAPPWFRASGDPSVGAALRALHAQPAAPWTVATLAAEASLSRGAFARRFRSLLGVAPLAYLTDWRMALARERLRGRDDSLAAVAAAVGYGSEYAFAAAFKRHHGTAPGRWRTAAHQRSTHAPPAPGGLQGVGR
jgi:AraC-like DNA-binding protein